MRLSSLVFCFQAKDGIRDLYVTGVQTCALPIWRREVREVLAGTVGRHAGTARRRQEMTAWRNPLRDKRDKRRSEEHTSELQSRRDLVCRLLLEKINKDIGYLEREQARGRFRSPL